MPYLRTRAISRGTNTPAGNRQDILKLYRAVNSLKRNQKLKHYDTQLEELTQQALTVSTADISAVPQGTLYDERIGNTIRVVKIQIRGRIASNSSGFHNPSLHIVRDRGNKEPQFIDFTCSNSNIGAFIKDQLYQELFHMIPQDNTTGGAWYINKTINLKYPITVRFSNVSSDDKVRNQIYAVVRNTSVGNVQSVKLAFRVWFYDPN